MKDCGEGHFGLGNAAQRGSWRIMCAGRIVVDPAFNMNRAIARDKGYETKECCLFGVICDVAICDFDKAHLVIHVYPLWI